MCENAFFLRHYIRLCVWYAVCLHEFCARSLCARFEMTTERKRYLFPLVTTAVDTIDPVSRKRSRKEKAARDDDDTK